ncbi:MAG: PASTA domain-containing protein [Clostridiales bacterium]|nr:MAG: PASTA domain-containing protein [Clostridiales bacterium]
MSDYKGRDFDSAEKELTKLGLKVTKSEEKSESASEGEVIRQSPSAKNKA